MSKSIFLIFMNVFYVRNYYIQIEFLNYYLTMSTAPALTLGSLPVTETLAVKEPSMLNTTHSVFGGITAI